MGKGGTESIASRSRPPIPLLESPRDKPRDLPRDFPRDIPRDPDRDPDREPGGSAES